QQQQQQQHRLEEMLSKRQQRKLAAIHRMSQMLHQYPNIEGAVHTLGNSWLGRKIRNRLEHKLDMAADQVVSWWYNSEVPTTATITVLATEEEIALEAAVVTVTSEPLELRS
ncbi:hypothetical protein BX616_009697, partial [Lobosporangium transversale]